jgi:hypothetical protein
MPCGVVVSSFRANLPAIPPWQSSAHPFSRRSQQRPNLAPICDRLGRVESALQRVLVTLRSAGRFSAVHPAAPVRHRGRLAWSPGPCPGSATRAANRCLSAIEPVSAPPKRKLENRQQRPAPKIRPARIEIPAIAGQRLVHPSLTRGNDGDSPPPGNNTPETGAATEQKSAA